MVGVVIDVGIGRLSLEDVQKMLELANHRPNLISEMVPACGNIFVSLFIIIIWPN